MMSYVQYAISQLSMYESLFVVLGLSSAQVPECFFLSFYPGVYAYPMVPNPTHYASRLSYGIVASWENVKPRRLRVREHPIFPPCHLSEGPFWESRSV